MTYPKIASVVGASFLLIAGSANAQTENVGPGASTQLRGVLDRGNRDYDPLGIRVRSFLIFPTLGISEGYDSNLFATPTNTRSDFITSIAPTLNVASDWSRHSLALTAGAEMKRYATVVSENQTNANVTASGRLDVSAGTYITGAAGYRLAHEDRASPDAVNGTKPTEYHLTTGNVSFVREPSRIGLRIDGGIASFDYNNVASSTGAVINQSNRNRVEYVLTPRVSYELIPGYQAFVRGSVNKRDYASRDIAGFDRSSHGYEIDAGAAIDLTGVTSSEIYVGYLKQDYQDSRLPAAGGVAFGGNLLWNVTELTSVRAGVSRTVDETTVEPASSSVTSAFRLSVEHELLRNVLVSSLASYAHSEYQGTTRTDDVYAVGLTARYLLNRHLSASADVNYSSRSSTAGTFNYDRVTGTVGVKAGF